MSKFSEKWASQTELGKFYGMSAIAIGKELEAFGLRDGVEKIATKKAIDEGWCISTPLKDGTAYWMWSRAKLKEAFSSKGMAQLGAPQKAANEVMEQLKKAQKLIEEGSKLGYWMQEAAYDNIPKDLVGEVQDILKSKGIV